MLRVARGPRASEKALLADLARLAPQGLAPELNRPITIVVPSESLRRQLQSRLLTIFNGACLGVDIRLPYFLAERIVQGNEEQIDLDPGIFEIIVRREAAKKPGLASTLERFHDGLGQCISSVRDLLSAGLESEHTNEAISLLRAEIPSPLAARAEEILDLAIRVRSTLADLGLDLRSTVLARATKILKVSSAPAVVSSAFLIYGFSDAPGRTIEFLRAIGAAANCYYYLDLPPEISDSGRESTGSVFARKFARGLGFTDEEIDAQTPARTRPAAWTGYSCVGVAGEVKECAGQVAKLIDNGVAANRIGIVVRDTQNYLAKFQVELEAQGVPRRGSILPSGFHPDASRLNALILFLKIKDKLPLDRFFELFEASLNWQQDRVTLARLSLLTRHANLRTIAEFEQALEDKHWKALAGHSLATTSNLRCDEEGWIRESLSVPHSSLEEIAKSAKELRAWGSAQNDEQTPNSWFTSFHDLCLSIFNWNPEGCHQNFLDAIKQASEKFSRISLPISLTEFGRLVEKISLSVLEHNRGETAHGVSLLNLEQARSLTFDHLFLLGVNRGQFPRLGAEDPLLIDTIRRPLAKLLPALSAYSQRSSEESYLFAQSMEATSNLAIFWQRADHNGKVCARSPFVDRLELEASSFQVTEVPRDVIALMERQSQTKRALTPLESSVWAGLVGDREDVLETQSRLRPAKDGINSPHLSAARQDVIIELDPRPHDAEEKERLDLVSPWFGHLGTNCRPPKTYVTYLESTARCPWKAFLSRLLKIDVTPDPWRDLPEFSARLLGNAVHRAMEILTSPNSPASQGSRPEPEEISEACASAANYEALREGIRQPGLVSILAEIVLPFVNRAFELDWQEESPIVKAQESEGQVTITLPNDELATLYYRADRIDQDGTQTDYKTGRTHTQDKTAKSRQTKLLKEIEKGFMLQGAAYAAGNQGPGRYLYLKPDIPDEWAKLTIELNEDTSKRFEAATAALMDTWQKGVFPPRLEEPNGVSGSACQYCELKSACIHGDSGLRSRLAQLAATKEARTKDDPLARLWYLASYVNKKSEPQS